MPELNDKVEEFVQTATPKQIILTILIVGVLSGGGGHITFNTISSLISDRDTERLSDTITEVNESISELNQSIRSVDNNIQTIDRRVTRNQCEIRALREGFEWLECWGPDPPR
jgi:peptidoglycan hydrolase CwlO-like protein